MEKRVCRVPALTAAFLLLFLLSVSAFWQQGRKVLWNLVFPGDSAATVQAVEAFAQELKAGEPVKVAAEAFCRTVLDDGSLTP